MARGRFGGVVRGLVLAATLVCLLGAFALTGSGPRTVGFGAGGLPSAPDRADCVPEWVAAWHAAAQPAPADPALAARTLRMVVIRQVTGSQVRVADDPPRGDQHVRTEPGC